MEPLRGSFIMKIRSGLADAIKAIRHLRCLSQEDFSGVSSRTYLSSLERRLKSPTVDKVCEIAEVLVISPAALLLVAQSLEEGTGTTSIDDACAEAKELLASLDAAKRKDRNSIDYRDSNTYG